MAKTAFGQWDTTAANNTDINSIPIDGAVTTANQVDDIQRETMSQLATARTTAANFRANTSGKLVDTDGAWAAGAMVALTDAATISVDMSTFINASLSIGGNRTLGAPTNTKVGQSGFILIQQDATGSRTLAYHANWRFAFGSPPVLSTTAFAYDILFYTVVSSIFIPCTLMKGVT